MGSALCCVGATGADLFAAPAAQCLDVVHDARHVHREPTDAVAREHEVRAADRHGRHLTTAHVVRARDVSVAGQPAFEQGVRDERISVLVESERFRHVASWL